METVLPMRRHATVRGWWILVAVESRMVEDVCGRRCRSSEPFRNAGPDALEWRDVAETEVEVVARNQTRIQWGCLMYRLPM